MSIDPTVVSDWLETRAIIVQFLRDLGGPVGQAPTEDLNRYAEALIARFAAKKYVLEKVTE